MYASKKKYYESLDVKACYALKLAADEQYYNSFTSEIEDWEYDILKSTLEKKDPNYTLSIGCKVREGDNRVKLPFWLGSMNKITNPGDIRLTSRGEKVCVQEKLDGISCLLVYGGKSGGVRMYTRGDGKVGADISYLSKYIKTVPCYGAPKSLFYNAVRGELIMKKDIFKVKYASEFANPRNMVAGRIGAKVIREGITDIDFVAYEIIAKEGTTQLPPSEQLETLRRDGFLTAKHNLVCASELPDTISDVYMGLKLSSLYEIDGVIAQANLPYTRNLSGNPDYAFAFKMQMEDNTVQTRVEGVIWNVSKWGVLKPRIRVNAAVLGGVKITHATGFNAKFIVSNCIGPGAAVLLTRSGDVIPYIYQVIHPSESGLPDLPTNIPYTWNDTKIDIVVTANAGESVVKNKNAEVKLISAFFSKLKIKHVAEATVAKMYDVGLDTLLKIVSASKADFERIDTFGTRMAARIYENIHAGLQGANVTCIVGSSGVLGFGMNTKRVESLMKAIPDILSEYKVIPPSDMLKRIMAVEGFADKTARQVMDNIHLADRLVSDLLPYMSLPVLTNTTTYITPSHNVAQTCTGLKFVISGFRDDKLEVDIENRGGKVVSAISRQTTALITNDLELTTGKAKKARELNVKILDREQFMDKYICCTGI